MVKDTLSIFSNPSATASKKVTTALLMDNN